MMEQRPGQVGDLPKITWLSRDLNLSLLGVKAHAFNQQNMIIHSFVHQHPPHNQHHARYWKFHGEHRKVLPLRSSQRLEEMHVNKMKSCYDGAMNRLSGNTEAAGCPVAQPRFPCIPNFSSFTDCVSSHCHDVSNGHTLVLKTQTKPLPMDSNNPKPLYPFAVHPGHWRSPLSLLTTRWEASPKDLGPSPELKSQWLPLNPHSPSPLTALTL